MVRRRFATGVGCAIALLVTVAASASAAANGPRDILFVGNSFTFYNNGLHNMLRGMMEARDRERGSLRALTYSGAALSDHAQSLPAALAAEDWDVVILQGHSRGALDEARLEDFHRSVRHFVPQIRAAGARPVLFMTWARADRPEEIETIAANYWAAGRESGAAVAPAGLAFDIARRQAPGIVLHMDDRRHPTLAGSYLAACVFYAVLFDETPVGMAFTGGLDAGVAGTLQGIAAQAVAMDSETGNETR